MPADCTAIRVLLIEDSPCDAFLFKASLANARGMDFQIETAERLIEGLAILQKHSVDVVVTDLNLPDSVGLDTIKKLVESARGLPIIALTGWEDPVLNAQAIEHGANCYWSKNRIGDRDFPSAIAQTVRPNSNKA